MQTSSVVLAVLLSAHAVASIAAISLAVNSRALEVPSSIISPNGSAVLMINGVIGSVENELIRPFRTNLTWVGG